MPDAELCGCHARRCVVAHEIAHRLCEPGHGVGPLRLRGLVDAGDLQAFPRGDGDLDGNQRAEQPRKRAGLRRPEREHAQPVAEPDDGDDAQRREAARAHHHEVEARRDADHEVERQRDALDGARDAPRRRDAVDVQRAGRHAEGDQDRPLASRCAHGFSSTLSRCRLLSSIHGLHLATCIFSKANSRTSAYFPDFRGALVRECEADGASSLLRRRRRVTSDGTLDSLGFLNVS